MYTRDQPFFDLHVDIVVSDDTALLTLTGDLDRDSVTVLDAAIAAVSAAARPVVLVLDLGGVPFIDAGGVRYLRTCHADCLRNGTRLLVRGAQGMVRHVLRVLDLTVLLGVDEPGGYA